MTNPISASGGRLLIVSNRLPFTVTVTGEGGELAFKPSAGGLVSGLQGYLDSIKPSTEYVWVGWPGSTVADHLKDRVKSLAYEEHSAYPVFLTDDQIQSFYYGFSNDTIWPLFHYFPTYVSFEEERWCDYLQVNQAFCDAVLEIARPDDTIWVHDYQLMLLPQMIREGMPDVAVGFFLHIPFPSYEVFRLLPRKWGVDILLGLLGADLVGFHTHDYTRYFLRSVLRILGYEHNMGQVTVQDRVVQAETFPLGIDFQKYWDAAQSPQVQAIRRELDDAFEGRKLIMSIDRLDYTKGLINRLQGYQLFLKRNPHWHGKVVLALNVVPSREEVEQYQHTKEQIQELVGRINGEYGTLTWTPVVYQYKSHPFDTLIAMYNKSDVALITPLRDGMNLVAKEYIATRTDQRGVLILSEMAGAARELGEALIINPNSREEIADALREALEMPEAEQVLRNRVMQNRLRRYNVVAWGEEFIARLFAAKEVQARFRAKLLTRELRDQLLEDYARAKRRILFFDYDGTLVPFVRDPKAATPTAQVMGTLSRLAEDPKNQIVVISGRDRDTLQAWFGDLPLGLVAEHGIWTRSGVGNQDPAPDTQHPAPDTWQMLRHLSNDWKPKIRPLLEMFVDRLPGSFIEEKSFSLAWHYRAADPELAPVRAMELMGYLVDFTGNIDVQVLQGNKVIEVKCAGVSKGTAGMHWLGREEYDFIMAIGDDWTDEHLFMALPDIAYSLRVGIVQTYARFNLRGIADVLALLDQLPSGGQDKAVGPQATTAEMPALR